MWDQADLILRQATSQIADHVANFLPGMLVALLLVLGTFAVAMLARLLVVRMLRGLEFDRRSGQLGLAVLAGWSATATPSQTVGRFVYWAILLLGLLLSLTALNATMPSQLAFTIFQYVPHLLAAVVILVVGVVTARFVERSVLIGGVNMQLRSSRLLSVLAKWLVMIVAVAMALDHLGIGRSILLLAFGIFFGGVVLAAALAIGLGAKDAVGRFLDERLREPVAPRDKPVDHV